VIVYVAIALVVMVGLCLLGVDYGRAQYVRMQLQSCADGAARAAATGIPTSLAEARTRARHVGSLNKANGQPVTFDDGDFRFGWWNDETDALEAANLDDIDSVEVVARRTVPLAFGAMFGKSSVDVSARATAKWTVTRDYAIIGLDRVDMWGNATVDSYDSGTGPYVASMRRKRGDVGTNANITMHEEVKVYGDGTYKQNVTLEGNAQFVAPGKARKVRSTFEFDVAALPSTYTNMGSFHGSGPNSLTLTSGNYYFTELTTTGQFTLNVAGEVNIYVDGNIDIEGLAVVSGSKPANLRINALKAGEVKLAGNGALYADVYAPLSDVKVTGNGGFFGRLLGKTVYTAGNGDIHYDESLANKFIGTVSLVR
jgi:Flp pilus assembly protein TadG